MIPVTTTALVVSNDLILRSETRSALSELEVACTCCEFGGLDRNIGSTKFDCIFLDFHPSDIALRALERVRSNRLNRYTIIFAISDSVCEGTVGVSYTIPRSAEFQVSLKRSFISAQSLVLGEKRRHHRHSVDLKVSCICGDRITEARMTDLSERGACLECSLPALIPILQVSFALPGTHDQIQAEVKVAWREAGKAGVQFLSISESSRMALKDWLAIRVSELSSQEEAPVASMPHSTTL